MSGSVLRILYSVAHCIFTIALRGPIFILTLHMKKLKFKGV